MPQSEPAPVAAINAAAVAPAVAPASASVSPAPAVNPAAADPTGRCICRDPDYASAFAIKEAFSEVREAHAAQST